MKSILVTDSLFIHERHVKKIEKLGYEVTRIDKPAPSEEELIEGIKGKVGYILGGIEQVTERVINAADQLTAISFCGIGYKTMIPAWEFATQKGIAITNVPDGPTHAVAEWAITAALAMNRHIFELGRTGSASFMTTAGLESQNIGLIGYGRTGTHISQMLGVFRPASLSYYSPHEHNDQAAQAGATYKPLEQLLSESDIIFLCISDEAGEHFIDAGELSKMKDGALLVSFMHTGIVNEAALLKELQNGRIRAISDYPMKDDGFSKLPLTDWFAFNGSNAFNTLTETALVSDTAIESLLNVLETGNDKYLVNPGYKRRPE